MTGPSFGGAWTAQKLEILSRYLDAYTTALKNQGFNLIYVDAFAGAGVWRPQSDYVPDDYGDYREVLEGSASIALEVDDKPFDRFLFIEKDPVRSESLAALRSDFPDRHISVVNDDANAVIPGFCNALRASDRAVVFLDPFATQVDWSTVEAIARTQKIDCWILFPLMAVSRMMPREQEPDPALSSHLDRVFGAREHWRGLYRPSAQLSMFDSELPQQRLGGSERIAELYRKRLESVFTRVSPTRRTLLNSMNSPLFALFFAASNPRGAPIAIRIADDILLKEW